MNLVAVLNQSVFLLLLYFQDYINKKVTMGEAERVVLA